MKISRRSLLQFAVGGVAATAVCGAAGISGARDLPRPPGALTEDAFLARCSRCLRCLDVCQPKAILAAHWEDGFRNAGTPVLVAQKCIRCMECIRTCPTGALNKIPKKEVKLGTVVIVKEICLAWRNARRCDLCFRACAMKAVSMKDRRYPVLDASKCDACGVCMRRCPEQGALVLTAEGAKRYEPRPERLIIRLEDRVGPYEVPPPSYGEWFVNRLRALAQRYGVSG
ncbi:MAG: 4Fe-4S dicluster domain-containing protein [Desulfovibrio sp.]|jgi:ferredoxin|nr:4Fe-4S dicluster domain-containing protein [Desulfovibrio sp.]